MGQLLELNTILEIIEQSRKLGKKISLTNGCFDIMHAGHTDYLAEAKKVADILIVGINSDASVQRLKGPERPINNEIDRAKVLSALACVDYVFVFHDNTADQFIRKIKPDFYVKGDHYTVKNLPEAEVVYEVGAELRFVPITQGKSTSDIIDKIVVTYIKTEKV